VTYPSHYEGFGNAFLEAVYFGKPWLWNTYAVYARDIDPLGFKPLRSPNSSPRTWLNRFAPCSTTKPCGTTGQNQLRPGVKYFSYSVARRKLAARLANLFGEAV